MLDSVLTPLAFDSGNTDVALQLTLINWQAFGFAFLATRIPVKAIGRGLVAWRVTVAPTLGVDARGFF